MDTGKNDQTLKGTARWFMDRYLIKGLSGMAAGLFSTLIIGSILKQIGSFMPDTAIGSLLLLLGSLTSVMTGVGIGIGTAHALGADKFVLYSSAVNGLIGAYAVSAKTGAILSEGNVVLSGPGDPLTAFLATVIGVEIGRRVSGKTKVDLLVTPAVTMIAGSITALMIGPSISSFMGMLGALIEQATLLRPVSMGIIVSALMGIFLTLPISSAAICIILGLSGTAAGAATAGCCAQMVGFAVMSYKENGMNGLVAQGLGTSMLQIGNIIKNPRIWIPPILASCITGPLATKVFEMENIPAGAGMGTSGLVGPLLTWEAMIDKASPMYIITSILLLYIILPALLTLFFAKIMRAKGWIKDGDLKLDL